MKLPLTSNVSRPLAAGYGARLGDLYLRLVPNPSDPIVVQATEGAAARIQTGENPEDFLAEAGLVYSLTDMSGGEGLFFAHRRDRSPTDGTRYWTSRGIDVSKMVPSERGGIRLLRETTLADSSASTNVHVIANPATADSAVYANGSTVRVVTNLTGGSPSAATEDPHAGTQNVTGFASLGTTLYAGLGTDGIAKRVAGVWSNVSAVQTNRIWAAKGRLIIASGTKLVEIDPATGTGTDLIVGPTGSAFVDVCDADSAIVAASTAGHFYTLTESSGSLVVSGQVKFSDDEVPAMCAAAAGIVLVGTTQPSPSSGKIVRVYVAAVSNGALSGSQLVRTWTNGSLARTVGPWTATRDSIFFAVTETGRCQVWRYHLATGGISMDVECTGSAIDGLDVVADRLAIGSDGQGLYVEAATYVDSGYLISSAIDFFTATEKTWTDVTLTAEGFTSGATVTISVTNDLSAMGDPLSPSWMEIATFSSTASTGEPVSLPAVTGRWLVFKVDLTSPTSGGTTVTVSSVATRGFAKSTDVEMRLPINISDQVESRGRARLRVPRWGSFLIDRLVGMQGQSVEAELLAEGLRIVGVVTAVQLQAPIVPRRGSSWSAALVVVRGSVVHEGELIVSGPALGVAWLGVDMMGGVNA